MRAGTGSGTTINALLLYGTGADDKAPQAVLTVTGSGEDARLTVSNLGDELAVPELRNLADIDVLVTDDAISAADRDRLRDADVTVEGRSHPGCHGCLRRDRDSRSHPAVGGVPGPVGRALSARHRLRLSSSIHRNTGAWAASAWSWSIVTML